MEKILLEYIKKFQRDHRNGRRHVAVLLILAMLTTLAVNWNLRGTGIAATADYECGMEEHVHDKNCYELVCTKDGEDGNIRWSGLDDQNEDAETSKTQAEGEVDEEQNAASPSDAARDDSEKHQHIHTKKCYKLVCELPEHIHTSKCMSNIASDVEKKADWESTLPEFTSDESQAEKMVAVAESQIGYHESEDNFKLAEDGETKQGYTRYGEWYGNPYGNWSAMFAAFVLHYAGVSKSDFPVNSGCPAWIAELERKELYKAADAYEPNYGDIVFLDLDDDSHADHAGIVVDLERDEDDEDEKTIAVTAVVGDLNDEVEETKYEAESSKILGYGVIPGNGVSVLPDSNAPSTEKSENLITAAESVEFILYKKVGDTWQEVANQGTINDQDEIKVRINYKVPHGEVTKDMRTLTYELPDGIVPNDNLSGKITGKIGNTEYADLGDYSIGTDGHIKFVFNNTFISSQGEFIGGLEMTGKASLGKDSTGEKTIITSDGKTYEILPKETESDLTINKEVRKTEDGKLVYTITAASKNGTNDDVRIEDKITWSGLENVTVDAPTVIKGTEQVEPSFYTVTDEENSKKFTMKLPGLGAGESYTITYPVEYGKVNSENGSSWIGNTAKGFEGDATNPKSEKSTHTEISKKMIEKSGSTEDNNNTIIWTIKVNPEKMSGVAGEWTIEDYLNDAKFDFSTAKDLKVIKENLRYESTDVTADFRNSEGKIHVEDGCSYTITYKTSVDYGSDNSKTYNNHVDIKKGDQHYSADSSQTAQKKDVFQGKTTAGQELLEENTVKQKWEITLAPENGSTGSLFVTDTMLDQNREITPDVHWTTRKLLQEMAQKLEESSIGIQCELKCYDKNNNEVTDDLGRVVHFTLKLTPKTTWGVDSVGIVYQSLFSIESIEDNGSIKIWNEVSMNGADHYAETNWTKENRISKYVKAIGQWGTQEWHSGEYEIDYDKIEETDNKKILTYRIVVSPVNNTDAIEITDVLPDGLKYYEDSIQVYFANMNGHQYNVYKWVGNYNIDAAENKPEISIEDNRVIKVKIKGNFPQEVIRDRKVFVIEYKAEIEDDYWENINNNEKKYVNEVSWNGRTEHQDSTIKRNVVGVVKDGEQITTLDANGSTRYTTDIKYWVTINPKGVKLNGGRPLTLFDKLKADNVSVSMDLNSVKLYSYDETQEQNHYKGKPLTSSAFQFQYDDEQKQFTVVVPDEMPCVLEYVYTIENMNNKTSANFSNSAELTGYGENTTSKDINIKEATSKAWVSKTNKLTIVKVDADRYQDTLQGAEFQLGKFQQDADSENWSWSSCPETYITNEDGTCDIPFKTQHDTTGLDRDVLYRLTETKAPTGYKESGKKYYFVPLGSESTQNQWLNDNQARLENQNIDSSEIMFIAYNDYGMLYVPNKLNTLQVVKLWQDSTGAPITGTRPIKVRLYQNTRKLEHKVVTVKFANGNNTYMEKQYQVKPGSNFKFSYSGFWTNDNTKVHCDGVEKLIPPTSQTSGVLAFDYGAVDHDAIIWVEAGWSGMGDGFKVTYTPAEWKLEQSVQYGSTVELKPDSNYTYSWKDLPENGEDGESYYYTVEEESVPSGYTVGYMNNDGIQKGEIVITNKKDEAADGYTLPETGGTGTAPFTAAGLAIIGLTGLSARTLKRRREN